MRASSPASLLYKSLAICLYFAITHAQDLCVSKGTCHECIQTESCAWCTAQNFESPRCFQPSYPGNHSCPEEYIYNPYNELGYISNLGLTRSKLHHGSEFAGYSEKEWGVEGVHSGGVAGNAQGAQFGGAGITQIRPQHVSLKLRTRQVYSLNMYYTQAEDYPVDLYYLMDLSKSMQDDKEKLSDLGDKLAQTMQNITSNFTLGFGSFVDKVVMPYVSTIPAKLKHPCSECVAPYGFQNHLPLSSNTNQFSYMVREASVSGNLDAPEGGFDAIMQAVVCRNQIGWRDARRLLVFSTDAGFHYAGDGKLGGIVKPNDGNCHLDNRGFYTQSSSQDYPSVSQLNLFVKNNAINVIFAVTADKIETYKQLQSHIEGASSAVLSDDSSNIVELIKEQYEAIQSIIEMKHNASSASGVSVKFFSSCLDPNGSVVETNKCSGMKVGKLVKFRVDIEVLKCPKDPRDWKKRIQIYPVGMNESLFIDLEMLCDCPCERPDDPYYRENAIECNGRGTYMCGVCDCKKGSVGRFCECLSNQVMSNLTSYCISPINNLICSGRGTCSCGQCVCEIRKLDTQKITGKHCECDNFACERHHGKLCSGHGECVCGKCVCAPGWSGPNCACTTSVTTCIAPGTTDTGPSSHCSGKGKCVCGKCQCSEEDRLGTFCERCPGCSDKCDEFKDCVQCQQYKTGKLYKKDEPDQSRQCAGCTSTPIPAKTIEVNETNNENLCAFYDEDDCRFTFVYYYTQNKTIEIRALEERECPHKVFLLGIILAVIAAVVLLGLAILLLWKLLTTIHDRREFARFEKERMMAKWDTGENPIYKQATSTFKNPTYAGKG